MRKIYTIVLICCIASVLTSQTFTKRTIYEIQKPSDDSLHIADSLGNLKVVATPRWVTQASPYVGTKAEVTALVVVPPRLISFTGGGRTMILTDTGAASGKPWTWILVRYHKTTPTGEIDPAAEATFDANGYNGIQQGDIITIKGTVNEFPAGNMSSLTQLEPDTTEPVIVLSSGNPIPPPLPVTVADFKSNDNKVKYSTGESYESGYIQLTNLLAGVPIFGSATDATFYFFDQPDLNQMSTYDYSHNYSKRNGDEAQPPTPLLSLPPTEGVTIDTLRGFISTSAGSNTVLAYRVAPIFPGDMIIGSNPPAVLVHRRNPVVVAKDTTPRVTAKIYSQGGTTITSRKLIYSVDNGAWTEIDMPVENSTDSISTVTLPAQSVGSVVRYFIKVTDAVNTIFLTNSNSLTQRDTSKGFFTYKVLDRSMKPVLSIQDVQYTPYLNGYSPYVGAVDSVGGIVTADTSMLVRTALSVGGTTVYYMQSTNGPFSGIWFTDTSSATAKIKYGDSVIVTGTVSEFNDITNLFNVQSVQIVSSGNPVPEPVKLQTEVFGTSAINGDPVAEQYEGMLVEFDNVTVTDTIPYVIQTSVYDYFQYEISNSGQPMMVMRDGINSYSNDPNDASIPGITRLRKGTQIQKLVGVLHYASKRFKVVPRTNADYSGVTSVKVNKLDLVPAEFALKQNYPNPFNPATTIDYSLPRESQVSLKVYNLLGQEVISLVNEHQNAGTYSVQFDASRLSSGMYLYRIAAGSFTQVKKMLLLK